MKNVAIGILLAATVVFGGLYLQQTRKASQVEASADGLQQKVSELQSGLEEQERQTTHLRDQLEVTSANAAARTHEAVQIREPFQESLTNQAQRATAKASGPTNFRPSNLLSEMFKNQTLQATAVKRLGWQVGCQRPAVPELGC